MWLGVVVMLVCVLGARAERSYATLLTGPQRVVPAAIARHAGSARPATAAPSGGAQKAVRPASGLPRDVLLAGKACTYTPAVFQPILVEVSEFTNAKPITACNDTRLTATQQAACAKCIGIKRRDACLATVSDTYWGVDQSSCTWVGQQFSSQQNGRKGSPSSAAASKETRYSHGINLPWHHGMWLGSTTCKLAVRVEMTNPAALSMFPTATFQLNLKGWDSSGAQVLPASRPSFACVLKNGRRVCEGTLTRPAHLKKAWLDVSRQIWSNGSSNAAVEAWQQTGIDCLNYPPDAANCSALPASFNYNYVLRVVEQPCQPTSRPVTKALKYDEVPFAEAGAIMWPSGDEFDVNRNLGFNTQGSRILEWDVRVLPQAGPTAPMFVAVLKYEDWAAHCTNDGTFYGCDYSTAALKALGGSACYARQCKGRLDFGPIAGGPAPKGVYLVVRHQRYTMELKRPWILNATVTPPQTVAVAYSTSP